MKTMASGSRVLGGMLAGMLAVTTACATARKGPRLMLTPDDWQRALTERGIDPDLLPNPLAVTPAMHRAAVELAHGGTPSSELRSLQAALFDSGRFPFNYESGVTVTAREAFERREGNCVSFTNLFIALARSLGIGVRAALVPHIQRHVREEELVVVNQHVVAVFPNSSFTLVFDFDRSRSEPPAHYNLVDDLWVAALYANNLGVDRLRAGEPEEALPLLRAATLLAPEFVDALSNLGVALRQAGDLEAAVDVYGRALEISPGNPRVLQNLARVYVDSGHLPEAYQALEAARTDTASPFTMLVRGDLERLRGNLDLALRYYARAHRRGRDLVEPFVGEARVHLLEGDTRAAGKALRRALERDPQHVEARALLEEIEPKTTTP